MKRDDLISALYGERFDADKSLRYCDYRITFWEGLLVVSQITDAALNTSAFALLSLNAAWGRWVVLAAAILSVTALCFQASGKAKFWREQKVKYAGLASMIPSDLSQGDSALLDSILKKRHVIESVEGTILPCADVRAHNEVCRAIGIDDFWPLSRLEDTLGQYFPIRYRSSKK